MKRPSREVSIFSMSALDVLAMATGTFVLLVVILMPYYRMTVDANAAMNDVLAQTEQQTAEAEALAAAAAADRAATEQKIAEAEEILRAAAELRAAAVSLRQEADAADGRSGNDRRRIAELQSEIDQRIIKELDLVFVMDTTASMGQVIRELRDSMAGIVRILERLVPSLRVGVVTYRDRELPGRVVQSFPLTPTDSALDRIQGFMSGLRASPVGGRSVHEDLDLGLEEALRMRFRPSAKQTIIVIGDAAAHRPQQAYTLRIANQFATSGPRRGISTLFVPTMSFLRGGDGDREFFQDLGRAGGGGYNQHSGQLIEGVLLSVLED